MRPTTLLALVLALVSAGNAPRADAGSGGNAPARGGLTAAVVVDELPIAARDDAGVLEGFDVEVAREIGRRLGQPVTIATPTWEQVVSGDWGGAWNYAVASITPTEARAERLAFPAVYRYDAAVAVVRADDADLLGHGDLSFRPIGVKEGTTFEKYLRRDLAIFMGESPQRYLIENAEIRRFPDRAPAMHALAAGQGIDAVVTSHGPATAAIEAGMPLRILPGFLFWEPVAVAVEKDDAALAARVAAAVRAMRRDGTLEALSLEWFGIDMTDSAMR